MLEEFKIEETHQGAVFLYDSAKHKVVMGCPHRHQELEMNIVLKGSAEYILAHQRYRLSPGNIVWLFPQQEHQLAKASTNFEMYVVVFKESLIKNIMLLQEKYNVLSQQNPVGSYCRRISIQSIEKLERICESLCELDANNKPDATVCLGSGQVTGFMEISGAPHSDPVLLNAGLSYLSYLMTIGWHLFTTEGTTSDRAVISPAVERAVELMQTFPDKQFGLDELSVECGVSASRLSRLFNDQIGLSIVDYKNKLKLEHFFNCVKKHPEYSISEACYVVGFGSYSQFYKTFRQAFGISPKAYFSG